MGRLVLGLVVQDAQCVDCIAVFNPYPYRSGPKTPRVILALQPTLATFAAVAQIFALQLPAEQRLPCPGCALHNSRRTPRTAGHPACGENLPALVPHIQERR